jgi:hypothetical protein
MGEVRRSLEDFRDEHRSGMPPLDHIDTQILHIFGKSTFEWAPLIAQTFNTSHRVVLHYLHQVLGFKYFHLRWIPYFFG